MDDKNKNGSTSTWYVLWTVEDYGDNEPLQVKGVDSQSAAIAYAEKVDSNTAYEIGIATGLEVPILWVLSVKEYCQLVELHKNDAGVVDWQELAESSELGTKYLVQGALVANYHATKV